MQNFDIKKAAGGKSYIAVEKAPHSAYSISGLFGFFSAGTVFFSHNISARTVFFSHFQPSFSKLNGANCTQKGIESR